jgi:AmiR/NasT family two-component response regulator
VFLDGAGLDFLSRIAQRISGDLVVIDQAKGILMAREGISADEAFRTLRKASQRGNMKVRDLAQRVLDGVLPALPEKPPIPRAR